MKKHRKKIDIDAFIKARVEDNLSYADLAAIFDISVSTVKLWVKRLNLPHKTEEERKAALTNTLINKYGVDHPSKISGYGERCKIKYKERTGYDHPAHNPEDPGQSCFRW